jgi:uncharacterized membrane protein (UPF0127 family)
MRMLRTAAVLVALLLPSQMAAGAEVPRRELVVTTDTGERRFSVELADDVRERALGLMYRHEMPDGEGMLFDFGSEQPVSFWMRNTYISLDMLFIREDGTIESIAERATPLSDSSILSDGPVRYVLEINAGLSDELGIEEGDVVSGPALEPSP